MHRCSPTASTYRRTTGNQNEYPAGSFPGTGIAWEDISGRPPPSCKITMKAWNAAILGTAIIWAGVIIAVALLLAGTGYFSQLIPILGGGAAGNLIVVAGARNVRE